MLAELRMEREADQPEFGSYQSSNMQGNLMDPKDGINYPVSEKREFDEVFYTRIKTNLTDNLRGLEWTQE